MKIRNILPQPVSNSDPYNAILTNSADCLPFTALSQDVDFGSPNFRPFGPVNNDLSTTTRRECDFYAEDICLASSVYPG